MSDTLTKEPAPQPGGEPGEQSSADPPRRGRGRPRKPLQEPTGPPVPKRPRGRPKGSKDKGPRAPLKVGQGAFGERTLGNCVAFTQKVEPERKKRPRGRPRKWPQRAVQEAEEHQGPSEEVTEGPSEQPPSEVPAAEEVE